MKLKYFLKLFIPLTIGLFALNILINYFMLKDVNLISELITSLITGLLLAATFTYANSHLLK